MSARHAELVGRTRSELRAVRSNVDATLNHRLNQARSNMTAAVAGLSERLDGVEARIEQVAKAAETSEVARIVTLENQIREGIARLEESIARQHADWAEQARAELVARPPATPPTA
jgi:peptidoglycan hydrolase CwlO-like protein